VPADGTSPPRRGLSPPGAGRGGRRPPPAPRWRGRMGGEPAAPVLPPPMYEAAPEPQVLLPRSLATGAREEGFHRLHPPQAAEQSGGRPRTERRQPSRGADARADDARQ